MTQDVSNRQRKGIDSTSQETGKKGDRLVDEREIDNSLPGDKTAGQNVKGFNGRAILR